MKFSDEMVVGGKYLMLIKYFHWTTGKGEYDTHKILDSVYGEFSDKLDELSELVIMREKKKTKPKEAHIDFREFKKPLDLLKHALEYYTSKTKTENYPEIDNVLAEICAVFNNGIYLLEMV